MSAAVLPPGVGLEPLDECTLLLRFGDAIDAGTNARVHALARRIQAARPPWLRELVPAYSSLALQADPDVLEPGDDPMQVMRDWLQGQASSLQVGAPVDDQARTVEIAVRYGGEDGPDLGQVAAHAGLTPRELVERHSGGEYRVAMLGFAPGFPYLIGLDPALAMPRLAQPRTHVPAGSVAIGGAQTGIYPRPGPGGWRVIGRTAARLFDPQRDPPALLQPGDRVRFVAAGILP